MFLSHLSRAYRWKYLLEPLGFKSRFINRALSVFICYISNLGIPRSGEILRATSLSNYEKISFEKTLGSIIAERIVDLAILIFIIIISLFFHFDLIIKFLFQKNINVKYIIAGFFVFIISVYIAKKLAVNSKNKIIIKIKSIINDFIEGVLSLKSIPEKNYFIIHTIFIWLMYIGMFYVIKWSFSETYDLTFLQILPAFIAGSLTITATNGGIGIFPLAVTIMLSAFGISKEAGLAFGWILWSTQTITIVVLGGLSFFILPLVNSFNSK
tara:strand:+ start:608 stop:1414 length:807 start_codon:yes stop_codon:yes gene_type:complete